MYMEEKIDNGKALACNKADRRLDVENNLKGFFVSVPHAPSSQLASSEDSSASSPHSPYPTPYLVQKETLLAQ